MAGADYRVQCDYSDEKIWRSQARMTWDGYLVKKEYWEPRQPQDFVRGRKDNQNVSIARPTQEDKFLTDNEVTRGEL